MLIQTTSKLIGITVAEAPEKVTKLLRQFRVDIPAKPNDKTLIAAVIDMVTQQDANFNEKLGLLIETSVPNLKSLAYDNFDFGTAFSEIGGGAAKGGASGGIVGGILGVLGGGLNIATTAKQQGIEKDRAKAMSFSALIAHKTAETESKGAALKAKTKIAIVVITALALLGIAILVIRNKQARQWKHMKQAA